MRAAYINQKNLTTDRVKCDVKTEPKDDVHQVKIEVRTSSCVFVALTITLFTHTVGSAYIDNGYIEQRVYRTDFHFPARALLCKTKFSTDISTTDISNNAYIEHVLDFWTTDISNLPEETFF